MKGKSRLGKNTCAGLTSLGKFFRDGRSLDAVYQEASEAVVAAGVRRGGCRPEWHIDWVEFLLQAVFDPNHVDAVLHHVVKGVKVPTSFCIIVKGFLEIIDIDEERWLQDRVVVVLGWVVWRNGGESLTSSTAPKNKRRARPKTTPKKNDDIKEVQDRMYSYLVGIAWDNSCESRWTHIGKLRARFILTSLGNNCLPDAIRAHLVDIKVKDSMITALEKMIEADRGNFSARSKLRLLRIQSLLCCPGSLQQQAIFLTIERVVDNILYEALGDKQRERLTIYTLTHPEYSPVAAAHETFVNMLLDFSVDNYRWVVFNAVGGVFADDTCRHIARAHTVKLDCGVFDHFDLRLGEPPYSCLLISLFPDAASQSFVDQKYIALRDIPMECCPFLVRRIKLVYKSRRQMDSARCRRELATWSRSGTSMDFSERSHNQMRNDARTSSRAKNSSNIVDRTFVRQVAAAHAVLGGFPFGGKAIPIGALEDVVAVSAPDGAIVPIGPCATTTNEYPSGRIGSAYIRFRALKVRAFCTLHAAGEPLDADQSAELELSVKAQWEELKTKPDEFKHYLNWNRVESYQRSAEQIVQSTTKPDADEAAAAPFSGVWACSSSGNHLFDPSEYLAFQEDEKKISKTDKKESDRDSRITIRAPVPARCGQYDADTNAILFGCYCNKKNICRTHVVPQHMVPPLDRLTLLIIRWAETYSDDDLALCKPLGWLHDKSQDDLDDEECCDRDVVFVVGDVRKQPKMVYCYVCSLCPAPDKWRITVPDCPYRVGLTVGHSRLSDKKQAFVQFTSDELVWRLLQDSSEWCLRQLDWNLPTDTADITLHDVIGFHKDFIIPGAQRKEKQSTSSKTKAATEVSSLMAMGDPLACSNLTNSSSSGDANAATNGDDKPADDLAVDASADEDDELVQGLPGEFVEDMIAEQTEAHGLDVAIPDDGDSSSEDDPPSALDYADACLVDGDGYITCSLPPFTDKSKKFIGRITSWAPGGGIADPLKINISCSCFLHGRCKAPAKTLKFMNEETLKVWLFRAQCEPGCSKERLGELRDLHREDFVELCGQYAASQADA